MDLATLIGIVAAVGCIITAIMMGGEMGMFVNAPSIMIVVAGTFAVVTMKFSLSDMLGAFGVAHEGAPPVRLTLRAVQLTRVRVFIFKKTGLIFRCTHRGLKKLCFAFSEPCRVDLYNLYYLF